MQWICTLLLLTKVTSACVDSQGCLDACQKAASEAEVSNACNEVHCDASYKRCRCSGFAALRSDGACLASPALPTENLTAASSACAIPGAYYEVILMVTMMASPELEFKHVVSQTASDSLQALIHSSVAAASRCEPMDLLMQKVRPKRIVDEVTTSQDNAGSVTGPMMSFLVIDLAMTFCSNATLLRLEAADFQHLLRKEMARYKTFESATFEILSYTAHGSESTSLNESSQDSGANTAGVELSTTDDGNWRPVVVGVVLALFCVAICHCLAFLYCRHKRRERHKLLRVANASEAAVPSQVFAHVACPFSPSDVEDDKLGFQDLCLSLNEGDVVEVVAGGGGWFYGRVVDSPERAGYFPESYVSWVGKIPGATRGEHPERHALVCVEHAFASKDLEGKGDSIGEHCLSIEAGEVVQVIASGNGWIYGHVAGQPERIGFFPENRATWLNTSEPSAAQENRSSSGQVDTADKEETANRVVVQVDRNFSPGEPGDNEEVVSFWDQCVALAEGDVVEIIGGGGGWLYGRVVGDPARAGYFPDTRVSWIGKPITLPTTYEESDVLETTAQGSTAPVAPSVGPPA